MSTDNSKWFASERRIGSFGKSEWFVCIFLSSSSFLIIIFCIRINDSCIFFFLVKQTIALKKLN